MFKILTLLIALFGVVGLQAYVDQMDDANQAMRDGNFSKAVKILEQLYPHHSENKQVLLAYGRALFRNQQYDRGIKILNDLLVIVPFHQEAHLLLGKSYIYLAKDLMALSHLERAISYDEDKKMLLEARYFLASTLQRLGRASSAAFEYQKIIESNPDDAYAYDQLARYYIASPQPQIRKAIDAWEKVLQLDKNKVDLDTRYNLGIAYFELGDYDKGFKFILEYHQVNKKDPEILRLMAVYYREKAQPQKAIELLEEAIKIDPANGSVAEDLAKIYSTEGDKNFNKKKFALSITQYLRQYDLFPENLELVVKIAKAYQQFAIFEAKVQSARIEAFKTSLNFYQRKLKSAPTDHETYFEMARNLYYLGDVVKGIAILQKATGIEPNEPRYFFWISIMFKGLIKSIPKENKKSDVPKLKKAAIENIKKAIVVFNKSKAELIKLESFGISSKEIDKKIVEIQQKDPLFKKMLKLEKSLQSKPKKAKSTANSKTAKGSPKGAVVAAPKK